MIDIIIFSKDRAMQLDCLLNSISDNFKFDFFDLGYTITVQYTTRFKESYDRLIKEFVGVKFINEDELGFKETFRGILKGKERVCLMVDDDIVFSEITDIPDCDIFSLRLGNNIKNKVHFDYNASLDGNIFKTNIIEKVFEKEFNNPNKLEVALIDVTKGYKMKYFDNSVLIGVPNNKVSDTSGCHSMYDNIDSLNSKYMNDYRIYYKGMNLKKHNNVHIEVDYSFVKIIDLFNENNSL